MTNRIRNASAALLFLVCLVALTSAFNLPNRSPDLSSQLASLSTAVKPAQQRTMLTLADRVAYQRAIEEVYWRHRIWPKERPDLKPSLDEVMSSAQLEKKVEDYLRDSQALEDYWQKPLSAEQLQAEIERMAQHTKQPEVLRELFEALGNDPFVIAECLARSALSERLATNFYAHDQRFHGELKRQAEAELRTHRAVRQMKQINGTYSEIELVRSDNEEIVGQAPRLPNEPLAGGAPALQRQDVTSGLKLNSREWDENVQKLARQFDNRAMVGRDRRARLTNRDAPTKDARTQIKTGVLSPLQEDEGRYYATAVVKKTKDRLKLATVKWRKEPFESWRARAEPQMPDVMAASSGKYRLPTISDGASGCTDDTWTATVVDVPPRRYNHTAVWTGSEMIVWGGNDGSDHYFNTGNRYNPVTDSWTTTSTTNAPTARQLQTAVWTGSEMIIWGGTNGSGWFSTGGRYNPSTDSWTATSITNAPAGRNAHTAVWTGSEMIVWGGYNGSELNTGGRYNPGTDNWTATNMTNVPTVRGLHTAVWTGSEMIVWGGYNLSNGALNTGGRYSPGTDSWTATSTTNVPSGRYSHTAVWTGSEMIVWGGSDTNGSNDFNTGGRYNPGTDSWIATSTSNAPLGRVYHTAVWTGSEMIVWGGDSSNGGLNTGGRYNPGTDSWIATSTTNAPSARDSHTAVWSGSEMIIWGGFGSLNTGGRYNPSTDSWTATPATNAPTARSGHTAVWTGSEMIVWGGSDVNTGGRYNPSTDSWTDTSTINAPSGRHFHTAIWSGNNMIVWGGVYGNGGILNAGGRYNPGTDSWIGTSISNAPTARYYHTAVWSGSEMIVWGGFDGSTELNTGGRYNDNTDTWAIMTTTNAPSGRLAHTAVWTGTEMIVWGGYFVGTYLNSGGRYNPGTDSWIATSTTNAPSGRLAHTAVWTGSEIIIWGGIGGSGWFSTGGRYNPGTDSWAATSTTNAPHGRDYHTAVWTGSEMIVWGGFYFDGSDFYLNTGGRYNPGTDSWIATSITNAPTARYYHTAVWTGSEMIVWGGLASAGYFNTGGRYCAQSQAPMAQSAFSRKTHGAAGTFDIPLPLTGNVGIECRSGGATNVYQMIINFANPVTVGSASVTSGTGSVSSFSVSGSQVTVNLTGVTNVQRITVTLFNVNDGTHMGNVPVFMGVLVGDVNGNSLVNASDVSLTKAQVGQPVTGSNFREDVNANGTISAADVTQVKANVGTALPP
jgi:N-acetylneuraminic acid mutarotase